LNAYDARVKMIRISLALIASLVPVSSAIAQSLDWHAVKSLTTFTEIRVTTSQGQTACSFVRATEDQLYCTTKGNRMPSSNGGDVDLIFERQEIRAITVQTYDYSKGFLAFLGGFGGGAGLDSAGKPSWFGGLKVGGPFSLDLQYDRLQGHSGFSVEGAAVLPLFRVLPFDPRREKSFLKFFGEPAVGYRAGGGPTGPYAGTKVLAVWLTDKWTYGVRPYIEYEHRFPLASPADGDNRLAFGVIEVLCAHCGFD
jgi:hypothetical protein